MNNIPNEIWNIILTFLSDSKSLYYLIHEFYFYIFKFKRKLSESGVKNKVNTITHLKRQTNKEFTFRGKKKEK